MHFRVSTRRKGDTVYRYGQLVESYRRPDGMPAHRVVGTVGRLTELEADNLKAAFQASKQGRAVVLPAEAAAVLAERKCQANYAYLAHALVLSLFRGWKLDTLLDGLAPPDNSEVPLSSVIAALVCQRCLAPASKLAAVSWFPTTALPELLDVSPAQFHNTRVHRTLDTLEFIEAPLQERLARRIAADGPVRVLYLDCTDTWFVGEGPDLAQLRITKEGLYKRGIGIALLCDADGMPLQWATVRGGHDERKTMLRMARTVAGRAWADQVPFVMDRAMGSASIIQGVSRMGLRFLTAVPAHEIPAWSERVPLGGFDDLVGADDAALDTPEVLRTLAERAETLGFEAHGADRWLLDLGVVAHAGATSGAEDPATASRARVSLRLARRAQTELEGGQTTAPELARRWEVTPKALRGWLALTGLTPELVARVDAGDADRVPVGTLSRIGQLVANQQDAALDEAITEAGAGSPLLPSRDLARLADLEPLRGRAVVVFGPALFARQRTAAAARLRTALAQIEALNKRARSPHSRRSAPSLLGEVAALLRKHKLTQVIDATIDTKRSRKRKPVHQVVVEVDPAAWAAQRAGDGLNLILAHPDTVASAATLVQRYFDKDKVEKDFRTIKSVLQLRPVHHRTDHKVRAHVTLCVLALLIERTLQRELDRNGIALSPRAAFARLGTCFLNRFEGDHLPLYTTTHPTPDQRALLDALGLGALVDDQEVARKIAPR